MKISGFTMVRNAQKYAFPIRESILSVLPLVDEMIVALGQSDPEDQTQQIIESIASDKIKIFHRTWDMQAFSKSEILSHETNFALSQCTGDWCFYLQADEVLHEQDYPLIKQAIQSNADRKEVDGILFNYHHFWGDFNHYLPVHGWYRQEIRLIKNHRGIKSVGDAQSFKQAGGGLLKVATTPAYVYHYGWVRPPWIMQSKKKHHDTMHHGQEHAQKAYAELQDAFEYGNMSQIPIYKGTHPAMMKDWITQHQWPEYLQFAQAKTLERPRMKHEKWRYKFMTWIEHTFMNGKPLFGYRNWIKIS